jgi:hypothetical protein
MTTQDLQPGIGTGTRVFFGQLFTDTWGWEIGYTGIYGMFGDALVTGPDNLNLAGDLATVVSPFSNADQIRGTYWSSLNIAEVNLFRYRCCRECRPTRLACTNCKANCHCINWIGGFIWAGLDEQSTLTGECCTPPETSVYAVQSTTNYYGAQIGMRGRREWCRWAVEGWWKTALCGTSATQVQRPIYDPLTGLPEPREGGSSDAGVGFIGSLNATLIYRLTEVWGLRAVRPDPVGFQHRIDGRHDHQRQRYAVPAWCQPGPRSPLVGRAVPGKAIRHPGGGHAPHQRFRQPPPGVPGWSARAPARRQIRAWRSR